MMSSVTIPKNTQAPISGTCECCLISKKSDFADVIKLRVLRCGNYPRSSKWALNAITRVLRREGQGDLIKKTKENKVL